MFVLFYIVVRQIVRISDGQTSPNIKRINFQPLELVSRYRDPQPQVGEN